MNDPRLGPWPDAPANPGPPHPPRQANKPPRRTHKPKARTRITKPHRIIRPSLHGR